VNSDVKEEFAFYYKNAKKINNHLCEKSNNVSMKEIDFNEAFLFHMSSLMISLLVNFFDGHETSVSNFLCARSLLEDISVVLYLNDELKDEKERTRIIKLFQCTHLIYEYRIYSKYPVFMDQTCNILEMENNYTKSLEMYSKELEIPKEEVESRFFDKPFPPFFGKPKYSFSKLIKIIFRTKQDDIYKALSLLSHPHAVAVRQIFDSDFLCETIRFFGKAFFSIDPNPPGKDFYTEKLLLVDTNTFLASLKKVYKEQKNLITNVMQFFNQEKGTNFVSETLRTVQDFIEEFEINRYLGYSELAKIKMRVIFETLAAFSFIYSDTNMHGKHRYDVLFDLYSQYLFFSSLKENFNYDFQINNIVDKAYLHYSEVINPSISKNLFCARFKSSLGWSIDEQGNTMSLTALVKNYIDRTFFEEKDLASNFRVLARIYYEESEAMTHGNGYLYSSNSGAFMEIDNCIIMLDIMAGNLLEMIQMFFQLWAIADDRNKKIADFLYKAKRDYWRIMEKKKVAYTTLPPRISKPQGF